MGSPWWNSWPCKKRTEIKSAQRERPCEDTEKSDSSPQTRKWTWPDVESLAVSFWTAHPPDCAWCNYLLFKIFNLCYTSLSWPRDCIPSFRYSVIFHFCYLYTSTWEGSIDIYSSSLFSLVMLSLLMNLSKAFFTFVMFFFILRTNSWLLS